MAGHQRHFVQVSHVPRRDNDAPRIRVFFQHIDDLRDLIDVPAIGRGPRAPLIAVDRAEVAVLVGPLVPDAHAVVFQVLNIGVALQKPQQLMNDGFEMHFLGGQQRKAGVQIKAQLRAEHAYRAGAGAVAFLRAVVEHVLQKINVLAHGRAVFVSNNQT